MPRIKFKKTSQIKFLEEVQKELEVNWPRLAKILKVHPRCLSDWKRGKYTITEKVLKQCIKLTRGKVEVPPYKILPDFWSVEKAARKGGLVIAQRYGSFGTLEGRRKGGLISQQRRKENPEKYRLLGCKVRKNFKITKHSEALAELIGIIMGDGSITNTQVRITLNKNIDKGYARFVSKLIKKIIGEIPSWTEYQNTICLTVSGVSLVEELERRGLQRGNKVLNQISFPSWISQEKKYRIACIRGLFDTDGGLYFHRHRTKGLSYRNLGFCFTNNSKPLIDEFAKTLSLLNLNFKRVKENRIYIYDLNEIIRFINIVGSSNKKNLQKLSFHLIHSKKL